jgi:coproporphyrinogen III oxidase
MSDLSQRARDYFEALQTTICEALERCDGRAKFHRDPWSHEPRSGRPSGGGGLTCVMADGAVFEKAGVNTSAVEGRLSDKIAAHLNVTPRGFFATGLSLVIHPHSPMVPTTHMNVRYIELERSGKEVGSPSDKGVWFGGGADLTPYYLVPEDATHFHRTYKAVCDRHDPAYYPRFKKWCDDYFYLKHRCEGRGVGGLFFDYLTDDLERTFDFVRDNGDAFLDAYLPIVERRRDDPWGEREKTWQQIRRGRYVEFNLVYDRGTLFGLETGGRIESILMSLPPQVRWRYDHRPEPGSPEAELIRVLQSPRDWV